MKLNKEVGEGTKKEMKNGYGGRWRRIKKERKKELEGVGG